MALTLLRKGFDWRIIASADGHKAASAFRAIARAHGSSAIWLPQSGVVCTEDGEEMAQALPYETWRSEVLARMAS